MEISEALRPREWKCKGFTSPTNISTQIQLSCEKKLAICVGVHYLHLLSPLSVENEATNSF